MRSFLGVVPVHGLPFAKLMDRGRFLTGTVLHCTPEDDCAMCLSDNREMRDLRSGPFPPAMRFALGARNAAVSFADLSFFYKKYGKGLRAHLPNGVSFAVWDARRRLLVLGHTEGASCYASSEEDGLWFSNEGDLLHRAVRVEMGLLFF